MTGGKADQDDLVIAPGDSKPLSVATGNAYVPLPNGEWAWDGNRLVPVDDFSFIVPGVAIVHYPNAPVSGVVRVWSLDSHELVTQFRFELNLTVGEQSVDPELKIENQQGRPISGVDGDT